MAQETSLDGSSDTVVRQSGNTVELHSGGGITVKIEGARLEVHADGSVDAYTAGPVHQHPAANEDGKAAPANDVVEKLPDLAAGRRK